MEKKRKANIFETDTSEQVNKAKNTADKQRSPRSTLTSPEVNNS